MTLAKSLKSVGAVMLTLAMLVGMLSVMGAVSFGVSAEEVTKFTANFAELNNSGEFTGSGSK
ncbi:MAG: hypothetical protein J6L00_00555, partial [Clostridia bacterium]|nr:hypothetical protein [Clostridia bacterium]